MVIAHHSNWMSGDNSDVISELCREESIDELALDPVVLGDRREKRENLLRDGMHWSPEGNAAVAVALESLLIEIAPAPAVR